jgi:hypothetical protein
VYNESFVQFATPFTQALNWCTFRSNLLNSYSYVSLTIRGSANPTGITITDPVQILAIANAMRTANAYTGTIGGNTWNVSTGCVNGSSPCGGSPGVVLHLNTSSCSCDGPGASWVIRPEINNENWGGLGNGNCTAPSQNMEVVFRYNTGSGGCPSPRTPIAITVDAPSVAPTSITNLDPSICNGASTQLDVVGAHYLLVRNGNGQTCLVAVLFLEMVRHSSLHQMAQLLIMLERAQVMLVRLLHVKVSQ